MITAHSQSGARPVRVCFGRTFFAISYLLDPLHQSAIAHARCTELYQVDGKPEMRQIGTADELGLSKFHLIARSAANGGWKMWQDEAV